MASLQDITYQHRQTAAFVLAISVVVMLNQLSLPTQSSKAPSESFTARLEDPPEPPKPEPPKSEPRQQAPKQSIQAPVIAEPMVKSEFATSKKAIEAITPVSPPKTEPLEAPPPPRVEPSVNHDNEYAHAIVTKLEQAKHYPSSREARIAHPTGVVRLSVEIDRSGHLVSTEVRNSSHSNLLDSEALKTARSITYPPFPEQVFVGENSHRFEVNLEYDSNSSITH